MAWWRPRREGFVLVRTTVATRSQAEALAQRLVQQRLAVCVHVQEVASVYRWEARVTQETEYLVEARTTRSHAARAGAALLQGHPYDTPLFESWPVADVPSKYAAWAHGEL